MPTRRKPIPRAKLTSKLFKSIVSSVLDDKLNYQEAAYRFEITRVLVGKLVLGFKKNNGEFEKLVRREES